jgi:hypothetical protein
MVSNKILLSFHASELIQFIRFLTKWANILRKPEFTYEIGKPHDNEFPIVITVKSAQEAFTLANEWSYFIHNNNYLNEKDELLSIEKMKTLNLTYLIEENNG